MTESDSMGRRSLTPQQSQLATEVSAELRTLIQDTIRQELKNQEQASASTVSQTTSQATLPVSAGRPHTSQSRGAPPLCSTACPRSIPPPPQHKACAQGCTITLTHILAPSSLSNSASDQHHNHSHTIASACFMLEHHGLTTFLSPPSPLCNTRFHPCSSIH